MERWKCIGGERINHVGMYHLIANATSPGLQLVFSDDGADESIIATGTKNVLAWLNKYNSPKMRRKALVFVQANHLSALW